MNRTTIDGPELSGGTTPVEGLGWVWKVINNFHMREEITFYSYSRTTPPFCGPSSEDNFVC